MEINIPVVQKTNLFVRYLDDEVIVSDIDHTGQYALNAVTSTSREHKCLEYLRENVSELETLLEDFSPLVSDTMITFYDTNGPYNGSPGVKSSTVQVDNRLRVKLNLGDVSSLCHELAHVNDLSRGNSTSMNSSKSQQSSDRNLKKFMSYFTNEILYSLTHLSSKKLMNQTLKNYMQLS